MVTLGFGSDRMPRRLRALIALAVLTLVIPALPGSGAATPLTMYMGPDEQMILEPPGDDDATHSRYDENQYPFVGAQPIEWRFTPTDDLRVTAFGGSVWFRTDATHVERDLGPVDSAYGLGLIQGDDPLLLTGAPSAYASGDSDNPVFPPFTPNGDYRVDFPAVEADVHLVAGEPVVIRVLVWSTNMDHGWLVNEGSFPHETLDSDLAVLYGSAERDSHVLLSTD